MLEEIKKKVQKKLNNAHKEIIVSVYRNMIAYHNDFCECNYCEVLKKYVSCKKSLTILKRQIDNEEIYILHDQSKSIEKKQKLQEYISELKTKKDNLKLI